MKTMQPLLTTAILAIAALTKHRFVGYDGGVCAANARALGVAQLNADINEVASVTTDGIMLVEAGAAIATPGLPIASDSLGRAVTATAMSATVPGSGTTVTSSSAQPAMTIAGGYLPQGVNGYAIDTAAAAGDIIRIKLA